MRGGEMVVDEPIKNNRINKHFHCIANEVDGKESCNSSDAMCVWEKEYEDGRIEYDSYCFSCGQGFSPRDFHNSSLAPEFGIVEGDVKEKPKFSFAPKQEPITKEEIQQLKKTIGFTDKLYRCLEPDWLMFFGHMVKRNSKGIPTEIYYPETENNKVVGFKIRVLPKHFTKIGRTGKSSQLSGQFRYRGNQKRIAYVGGENDKVAVWGALRKYDVHVVSPTTGEGTAASQAAAQYEFFDRYEEIYVGMDDDEAGRKATEEICKVLPSDKVKIITWSDKDPHKMLEDGKKHQIIRDFFNAKDYVDTGIKSAADAMQEVEDFLTAPKISLPPYLHRLEENMRGGIRSTGAIINICGNTSIGKSFFGDQLEMHWFFTSPLIPTTISLERTAGEKLSDMYSIYLKKNLTWFKDGHEAVDYLHKPEVKKLCEELVYNEEGKSRFYLIDERDGTVETLKKQVDRVIKQYGSRLIVFDPLTDFLRSLGLEAQEDFMMWQKMMKKEGIVFINILHTRKPPQSKDGEFKRVTEYDVLGSGTFVQSADVNIVLNRDKMAEDHIERNTTIVDMPKCRGGVTGEACRLYYDHETRQQYDLDDYFSSGRQENPDYVNHNESDEQETESNPLENLTGSLDNDGVVETKF